MTGRNDGTSEVLTEEAVGEGFVAVLNGCCPEGYAIYRKDDVQELVEACSQLLIVHIAHHNNMTHAKVRRALAKFKES